MLFLARKNLTAEKTRLALSVGGVAFAVLLIFVLGGLYRGWQTKLTVYLESLDANLVVGQKGSADTTHSMSFLPAALADELRRIPGVAQVDDFMGRQIMLTDRGKDYRLFLVGFEPESDRNGPLGIAEGTKDIQDGQVIIDRALARKAGYKLGDVIPLAGYNLMVAGISTQGNSLIYQYVFVTKNDARAILQLGSQTNYFLVRTDDPAALQAQFNAQYQQLNAMTMPEFIANNRALVTDTFLPIVGVLVVIAFIIGTAIVGLTIYTATVEKSREFGVLKAIGASNSLLYRVVLEQSFIAGAVGYLVGLGLSFVVAAIAEQVVSGFITSIGLVDGLAVFGVALAMSALAAWIPTRRLAAIDPALVFKS